MFPLRLEVDSAMTSRKLQITRKKGGTSMEISTNSLNHAHELFSCSDYVHV